jgi:hypothetical protein
MAYHKWDAEYYQVELREANNYITKLRLQVTDLQKELHTAKKQLAFCFNKPVLFVEQGSMIEPLQQVELLFQFRVVWLKQGAAAPIIYEPKRPA